MSFSLHFLRSISPAHVTLFLPLTLGLVAATTQVHSQSQPSLVTLKTARIGHQIPSPLKDTDFKMRFAGFERTFTILKEPLQTTLRIGYVPTPLKDSEFKDRFPDSGDAVIKKAPDQVQKSETDIETTKPRPGSHAPYQAILYLEQMMEISFPREV